MFFIQRNAIFKEENREEQSDSEISFVQTRKYEFDHVSIDIIDTQSNTSIFCDSWKLVHGHCPLFVLLYANDSFSNKETRKNTQHDTHDLALQLKRKIAPKCFFG